MLYSGILYFLKCATFFVARLAAKFVPTDRRPVDMGDINGGFEQFANTMRWAWYHEKRDGQEDESESEDLDQDAFTMVPCTLSIFCQKKRTR